MTNIYIDTNTLIYLGKSGVSALNGLLGTGNTIIVTDVVFYEAVDKGGFNPDGTPKFADANVIESWMRQNNIIPTPTPIGIADAASGIYGDDHGEISIQEIAPAGSTIVSDNAADFSSAYKLVGTISYLNQSFDNKILSGPAYAAARDEINAAIEASKAPNAIPLNIPNVSALFNDSKLGVTPYTKIATNEIVYELTTGPIPDPAIYAPINLAANVVPAGTNVQVADQSLANTLSTQAQAAGASAATGEGFLSAQVLNNAGNILGIVGLGALIYGAYSAATKAMQQIEAGDTQGANQTARNWYASTRLGLTGAEVGAAIGGGICSPLGPIAIACAAAGGVVLGAAGVVAGNLLTNVTYPTQAITITAVDGGIAADVEAMAQTIPGSLEATTTGGVTVKILTPNATAMPANKSSSAYLLDATNGDLVTIPGTDGGTQIGTILVTGSNGTYSGSIPIADVLSTSESNGIAKLNGISGTALSYNSATSAWQATVNGASQAVVSGPSQLQVTNNSNGTFAIETDATTQNSTTSTQIDTYSATGGLTQTVTDYTAGGSLTSNYNTAGWVSQSSAVDAAGDVTNDYFAAANMLGSQQINYASGQISVNNYATNLANDPLSSNSVTIPGVSSTVWSYFTSGQGDPVQFASVTGANGATTNYQFNVGVIGDPLEFAASTLPFQYTQYYTWNNGIIGDPLQTVQTRYANNTQLIQNFDFTGANWEYSNTSINALGQLQAYMIGYANGQRTVTVGNQTTTYGANGAVYDVNINYGSAYVNINYLYGFTAAVGGYDPYVPPDPALYGNSSFAIGNINYADILSYQGSTDDGGGGDGYDGQDGGSGMTTLVIYGNPSPNTQGANAYTISTSSAGSSSAAPTTLPLSSILTGAQAPISATAAETLNSGTGTSTLTGNGGADAYVIQAGAGNVTVINGGPTALKPAGEIDFKDGSTGNSLWFMHVGNNLVIDVLGTKEQVTVQNWYASPQAPVQEIVSGDGLKIDAALQNLVQAMAMFSAAHPAFNPQAASAVMPADTTLHSTLAASWHS